MSTAIGEKKLSIRPVELGAHQRARQSKRHPDCRSTTIKSRFTKISLALSSRRDNHPPAATAEMAILIVAVFPSRLSRYIDKDIDRPNRIVLAQIVVQSLGKQRVLTAIIANDKARHRILPPNHRGIISLRGVFTQAGSTADMARRRTTRSTESKNP